MNPNAPGRGKVILRKIADRTLAMVHCSTRWIRSKRKEKGDCVRVSVVAEADVIYPPGFGSLFITTKEDASRFLEQCGSKFS